MSKDYTKELEQMQHLMSYGLNESKPVANSNGIIEYSQKGADGKTYGILREGTKYFVKVAPKKDTQILAEDYDYIGGFLNRKGYDSYTKASNALNLELIHVNEACGGKEPVKSQFNINESAEWENTQTKEAKEELSRFYQLCENVDSLLDKNVHYIKEDKDAPFVDKPSKKNGGGNSGKIGSPDQGLGIKDKTFVDGEKKNAESMQKKYEKGNMGQSGFGDHDIDEDGGNPYSDKAKTSKEQGKSVSEGKKVIKLSEEQKKQVLAWRDDRAFVHPSSDSELDRSHGTEIGDTAPYDDTVNENFETTEWDEGLPGNAGIGDPKKYKKPFDNQQGVTQPVSEEYIFEVEMDGGEYGNDDIADSAHNILGSDLEADDSSIYDHIGKYGEGSDSLGFNFDEDPLADIPDSDNEFQPMDDDEGAMFDDNEDTMFDGEDDESELQPLREAISRIVEDTLNDFGKHPAYRKKVMTLPPNADGSQWGEDWNDESTKGEEPYGKQIGHGGDPFEEIVDAITNSVVTNLSKKKD